MVNLDFRYVCMQTILRFANTSVSSLSVHKLALIYQKSARARLKIISECSQHCRLIEICEKVHTEVLFIDKKWKLEK